MSLSQPVSTPLAAAELEQDYPRPHSVPPTSPSADADDAAAQRLAQLIKDFGVVDGFYAKLDRVQRHEGDEPDGYLGPIEFGAGFLTELLERHGGGKYRARIHNARGRYQTCWTFELAGAAKPKPAITEHAGPRRPMAALGQRLGPIRSRALEHQDQIESVRWFTPQRLHTRWDISVSTIYLIPREQLPYKEFGAGTELKRRRYHPDDVAAFEASGRVPAQTVAAQASPSIDSGS